MIKFRAIENRDAAPVWAGYIYQLLITIKAWLTLGPHELLQLEAGEDMDTIAPDVNMRRTSQIRRVKRNVTLSGVLPSLVNFHVSRDKNPDTDLFFEFLTTAKIGKEKNTPFTSMSGIEFWNSLQEKFEANIPSSELNTLRQYLLSKNKPSLTKLADWQSFRHFILNSADESLAEFVFRTKIITANSENSDLTNEILELISKQFDHHLIPAQDILAKLFYYAALRLTGSGEKFLRPDELDDAVQIELTDQVKRIIGPAFLNIQGELSRMNDKLDALSNSLVDARSKKSFLLRNNYVSRSVRLAHRLFQGRDVELSEIATLYGDAKRQNRPCVVALTGMSGQGKTELALQYLHQNTLNFSASFWITVGQNVSLQSQFAELAEELGFIDEHESTQEQKAKYTFNWLRNSLNWLLVIDDVWAPNDLWKELPVNNDCMVIITSQISIPPDLANSIEVREFGQDDACTFLLRATKQTSVEDLLEDAGKLVELLGRFPLALEYASAYIREFDISIGQFIELYKAERNLINTAPLSRHYPADITFRILLNRVTSEQDFGVSVIYFLNLISFISPNYIARSFFDSVNIPTRIPFNAEANAIGSINEIFRCLIKFSVLRKEHQGIYSVHSMLLSYVHDAIPSDQRKDFAAEITHILASGLRPNTVHANKLVRERLNTVAPLLRYLSEYQVKSRLTVYLILALADYCRDQGLYKEAVNMYKQAVTTAESLDIQERSLVSAEVYEHYLPYLIYNRSFDEAITYLEKAFILRQGIAAGQIFSYGTITDKGFSRIHALYGEYYYWKREYTKSLQLYEKAIAITLQFFPDDENLLCIQRGNTSRVLIELGRFAEAKELLLESIEILKTQPQRQADYVRSLESFSLLLILEGDWLKALDHLQTALSGAKALFPEDHPFVFGVHLQIAECQVNLGLRNEAAKSLTKATDLASSFKRRTPVILDMHRDTLERIDLFSKQMTGSDPKKI